MLEAARERTQSAPLDQVCFKSRRVEVSPTDGAVGCTAKRESDRVFALMNFLKMMQPAELRNFAARRRR